MQINDSLLSTLIVIAPGLIYITIHPHIKCLPHVFAATAMGFFLFSFQVHEKSILLPLLPASLLFFSSDPEERKWTVWINIVGTMSLWPLLKKDGLTLQYVVYLPLWTYLAYESLPSNIFSRFVHIVCHNEIKLIS
jgi:alpha-1,3-glucosyltransferase